MKFVPVYQEIFEMYVVERGKKVYNLGMLYNVVPVKDKKVVVKIEKIHIVEVEK